MSIAGAGFLRVDVPHRDPEESAIATQFYPPSSVYCLTPTTEDAARAVAARCQPEPVKRWELSAPAKEADRYDAYDPDPGPDDDDFLE